MSAKLKLETPFVDARGSIQALVMEPMNDVAIIHSVKGSIRANHFHKNDSHYAYLIYGKIRYLTRDVDSNAEPTVEIINPGELFHTPKLLEHLMYFEEDSAFINISNNNRSHTSYEGDVVRVNLDKFI